MEHSLKFIGMIHSELKRLETARCKKLKTLRKQPLKFSTNSRRALKT